MLYTIKRKMDTELRHSHTWHYIVKPANTAKHQYCWAETTQLCYRKPIAFRSELEAAAKKSRIAQQNYRYCIEPLSNKFTKRAIIETI